jgi:osmotically-inducible protein OsmY
MNTSFKELILICCTFVSSTVFGVAGLAGQAGAQDETAPASNQPASVTISSTQHVDRISDEQLKKRVQNALHSDPYFYDEHVAVSVENGDVVLRGFVGSEWDLRDAVRIASKAAPDRRVIDNLSVKLGGNR